MSYTASISTSISAPVAKVWEALTDPGMIKQYLHGTEAQSQWKEGSAITFKGVWKGNEYADKGIILKIIREKILKYTWLSSMSGLEDQPENYSIITYELTPVDGRTLLHLTQENIPSEEGRTNSEKNWKMVLEELRKLLDGE